MNKRELEIIISKKLGAESSDQKTATDVFIKSISEHINVGDTVRIPDIGIFQLKKIEKSPVSGTIKDSSTSRHRLFYVPLSFKKGMTDIISFNVSQGSIKKHNIIEEAFSISIGKPLIPLSENNPARMEEEISSIMLRGSFREKANEIIENAIHLKDFKIDVSPSLFQEDIIQSTLESDEEQNYKEVDLELTTIPWDFGIPSEPELPAEKITGRNSDSVENSTNSFKAKSEERISDEKDFSPSQTQQKITLAEEQLSKIDVPLNSVDESLVGQGENDIINNTGVYANEKQKTKNNYEKDFPEINKTGLINELNLKDSENKDVNNQDKKKKFPRWKWFVIVLVFIIAACLAYYFIVYHKTDGIKLNYKDSQLKPPTSALVQFYDKGNLSFVLKENYENLYKVNFKKLEI